MILWYRLTKKINEIKKAIIKNKSKKRLENEEEIQFKETIQRVIATRPKQLDEVPVRYKFKEMETKKIENIELEKIKTVSLLKQILEGSHESKINLQKDRAESIKKLNQIKNKLTNIDLMCKIDKEKDVVFAKKYLSTLLVQISDELNKPYLNEKLTKSYKDIYLECKKYLERIEIYEQIYHKVDEKQPNNLKSR